MATKTKRTVAGVPGSAFIPCHPRVLPESELLAAANTATSVNPANMPNLDAIATSMVALVPGFKAADLASVMTPQAIAIMTGKYWGKVGVKLGVQFMDGPNQATRNKILAFANLCGERANIKFMESSQGEVRLTRAGSGYWSYLGTDIRHIDGDKATMNLQGFTENSPSDVEYMRVVPHEFLHTCGCPHEHSRRAIIELLDQAKTIQYYKVNYGWSAQTTKQQIFTPVEEQSILGSPTVDQDSVMTYSFPGACTKNGKPIVGGSKITANDHAWLAKQYPKADVPTPQPPTDGVVTVADFTNRVVTTPAGWTHKTV